MSSSAGSSPRKRSGSSGTGTSGTKNKLSYPKEQSVSDMGGSQSRRPTSPSKDQQDTGGGSSPERRTTRANSSKEIHVHKGKGSVQKKSHKAGAGRGRKPLSSSSVTVKIESQPTAAVPTTKTRGQINFRKGVPSNVTGDKKTHRKGRKSKSKTVDLDGCPFRIDEKVLCYEPDPTKYRVLYDAKVLNIATSQDAKGNKTFEYLIHFQGWNSSWDRYVTEDFILKDTDENRQLQQELNDKADAVKKPMKGNKKKISVKIAEILGEKRDGELEDGVGSSGLSDEDDDLSDGEEYEVDPVVNPVKLQELLALDHHKFHKESKLVKLPAKASVVHILEDFVIRFGMKKLKAWNQERIELRNMPSLNPPPSTPAIIPGITQPITQSAEKITSEESLEAFYDEKIHELLVPVYHEIERAREAADALRIMFDFYHHSILLYPQETAQHSRIKNLDPRVEPPWDIPEIPELDLSPMSDDDDENNFEDCRNPKRKKTVSERSGPGGSGTSKGSKVKVNHSLNAAKDRPSSKEAWVLCGTVLVPHNWPNLILPYFKKSIDQFIPKLLNWKLVSKTALANKPAMPSAVYGLVHLLRLFTKLPELMDNFQNMHNKKLSLLMLNINLIINDIVEHYGLTDDLYIDKDLDEFPPPPSPPKKEQKKRRKRTI